ANPYARTAQWREMRLAAALADAVFDRAQGVLRRYARAATLERLLEGTPRVGACREARAHLRLRVVQGFDAHRLRAMLQQRVTQRVSRLLWDMDPQREQRHHFFLVCCCASFCSR